MEKYLQTATVQKQLMKSELILESLLTLSAVKVYQSLYLIGPLYFSINLLDHSEAKTVFHFLANEPEVYG